MNTGMSASSPVGSGRDRRRSASASSRCRNLDKVLYPETGTTKGEAIEYYARIAPVMVPHLAGRCITLKRFPNGVRQDGLLREALPEASAGVDTARRSGPATTTATSATAGSTSRRRWCGRRTWPRSSCTCRWPRRRPRHAAGHGVRLRSRARRRRSRSAARSRCGCARCSAAVGSGGLVQDVGLEGTADVRAAEHALHSRSAPPTSRWPSDRCWSVSTATGSRRSWPRSSDPERSSSTGARTLASRRRSASTRCAPGRSRPCRLRSRGRRSKPAPWAMRR